MIKQLILLAMLALATPQALAEPIVMGYWENWAAYENFPMPNNATGSTNRVLSNQIEGINALAYAFLEIANDGTLQFSDAWSDLDPNSAQDKQFCQRSPVSCKGFPASAKMGNFSAFTKTAVKHHVISIGGGGHDAAIEKAFEHPDQFISSLKALMEIYAVDALDIDYEPANGVPPAYSQRFIELTHKIKEAIPSITLFYTISSIRRNIEKFGSDNWLKLAKNLNYISIMGYDMHGSFDFDYPYTALHSALFPQHDGSGTENALKTLVRIGIPNDKIILGMPLYGRAVGGVQGEGLGQIFTQGVKGDLDLASCSTTLNSKNLCSGLFQYKTIVSQSYSAVPVLVSNQLTGVYAYNAAEKIFVSYDSPESAAAKAHYAVNNQLGGVMFWALRFDKPINDPQSILAAVSKVYGYHATNPTS